MSHVKLKDKIWLHFKQTVKPIFHCDAKPFLLGPRIGLDPKCHNFTLGYQRVTIEKVKICVTPNANAKICVTPNANPQHEQVEYRWHCVPNAKFSCWPCRFHVVCASFSALWKLTNANADSSGIQA